MKRLWPLVFVFIVCGCKPNLSSIPVKDVIANSWKYEHKDITIRGRVVGFEDHDAGASYWILHDDYSAYNKLHNLSQHEWQIVAAHVEVEKNTPRAPNADVIARGIWRAEDNTLQSAHIIQCVRDVALEQSQESARIQAGADQRAKDLSVH